LAHSITDQTIALAAIAQSAMLVHNIATKGAANKEDIDALINSLFTFDADSSESIYGSADKLKTGLTVLTDVFSSSPDKRTQTVLRYMMNMLNLQARLAKHTGVLDVLANRLKHAQRGNDLLPESKHRLNANLASIYQDTIGTLGFRINVIGNAEMLQRTENAEQIRALLLAGIRAATLWHQVGGKRWRLLFQRKKIKQAIQQLQVHKR
jgi:high frequency lysogenization protein